MKTIDNILIVLAEDHGQWAVGCYGNDEIQTPTLNYLARTGVKMDNAFTPIPVCSPARASLLTGKLPSQHGVHDYLSSTDPDVHTRPWLDVHKTLPQMLAEAGFETAFCGKWHLGHDERPQAGFDFWYSLTGDYPVEHGGTHRYSDHGRIHSRSGYKTQIITDEAVAFLRQREKERPFFLMASYTAPHSPWNRHPERLVAQYRQCTFADIPDDVTYPFGRQALESTFDTRLRPREALAQYYAAVSQIDEATGRLLDELEALGLRESTLVVYLSDHGLNCGHHGIWGKGNGTLPANMVEESIRIPLILNQPGRLFAGQRRREFVDHLDLFQTLAEYAGVVLPEEKEVYAGHSYLPLLENTSALEWRTEQFGEYGNLRMVRTDAFKLVLRYPNGPCELFDLRADPRETVNLFHSSQHTPIVETLTARIDAYFARYEDPEKSGLKARELPLHNPTEPWRST